MRVCFMGTPKLAADILEQLVHSCEVVGFQTTPDKVRGRGKKLIPSPVKVIANKYNIPEEIPKDIDFICVCAYGKILPKEILDHPKYACLNVHGSLLPRWRGAAPVERSILAGDEYSGESIMMMEEGMDTGDYCMQSKIKIDEKNTEEIMDEMVKLGAKDLLEAMNNIIENKVVWTKQDESKVTYANKIEKHELDIDEDLQKSQLKVQASSVAHPSKCIIANRNVTLLKTKISDEQVPMNQVIFKNKKLYLGYGYASLQILQLKPEGKRNMEAAAFAAGVQNIKSGEILWQKIQN